MCMRDRRCRWTLVLTACALMGMLAAAVWSAPEPPATVPVVQAAQEDVYNSILVQGTVQARRESQEFVYAPARVAACYVTLGQTVEAGQALVKVCTPEVPEQAQQAAAAFFEQAANVPAGYTAPHETVLCASMDGTVAQLPQVGDLLVPGVPAVRIGDFSDLTVEARVPELYAADLAVGQRANISPVSDGGTTVSAELREIAPYAVQTFQLTGGAQSAVVWCSLELADNAVLMPGTTVDVKLFTDTVRDAVTVPYPAIRQEGTQQYVFRCDPDGTVHRQDIETGYQLSQGAQVVEGVQAGDWLVCDSAIVLQDGERVHPYADS